MTVSGRNWFNGNNYEIEIVAITKKTFSACKGYIGYLVVQYRISLLLWIVIHAHELVALQRVTDAVEVTAGNNYQVGPFTALRK